MPVAWRIGDEGDGWAIARYLLEFERGGFVMNGRLRRKFARVQQYVKQAIGNCSDYEAAALRSRLVDIDIDLLALAAAELRVALSFQAGDSPGTEAMILKLEFTELLQRIEALGVAALCDASLAFDRQPDLNGFGTAALLADARTLVGSYLNNRAATIYGGSSEIQREIVARTIAGST
ncbi:MAG: acyl-CoA dehydrogenase family protein [Gammaproteobacteria bacterium]|nr:acyl-CoA dehydrogenase family protein [Gammaproteobacteria bacterium]